MEKTSIIKSFQFKNEWAKDGNIYKSIEHNKVRFELSEQVCQIFKNTAERLGW